MQKYQARAVVTGLGVVSPIGIGKERFLKSLQEGSIGIDQISLFDPTGLPSIVGAEVRDFKPEDFIDRNEIKKLGRAAHMGIVAAQLALSDANISLGNQDKSLSEHS